MILSLIPHLSLKLHRCMEQILTAELSDIFTASGKKVVVILFFLQACILRLKMENTWDSSKTAVIERSYDVLQCLTLNL